MVSLKQYWLLALLFEILISKIFSIGIQFYKKFFRVQRMSLLFYVKASTPKKLESKNSDETWVIFRRLFISERQQCIETMYVMYSDSSEKPPHKRCLPLEGSCTSFLLISDISKEISFKVNRVKKWIFLLTLHHFLVFSRSTCFLCFIQLDKW